ncbi:LysR family transcriptional regulator [Myxococcus sp. AM009]|uniref:LysR family transcriptional regulator n=1 Tax=unclassified Myxococcus TaxID=2648731 RepID=UPI001595DD5A|nr:MULTISPECIES: LysR family transcriptional regulator [unclassified Myxococcus]NVI98038.1 LysR family transcriptional regulator [Myxococcus sp. AM009]NVJ15678.1 LysR family transcriptional regulator [Myxococcus sp. AM010]
MRRMPPRKLVRHLVWLESFAAAVESGSIEAAAEHLGVARSVVSEHVRALELALADGAPLLERGPGRRLQLTARGERLFAGTQTPLHQLDMKRLRDLASAEPVVRLGLNPTLSLSLVGDVARDAAAADLKLVLSFGGPHELTRQVQTRQLDLALDFTPLPTHEGVESESLLRMPFVVLAGPDNALTRQAAARKSLRVKDLEGQRFVDWLRDDPYGGANSARFAAHGVAVEEVGRAESFLLLYELLRAFRACAITPDLRPMHPFPPDLHAWPLLEEEPQAVEVVALWPSGALSPGARLVLDGLRRPSG